MADSAARQLSDQDRQARDAALAQARLALAKSDTAADQAATAYNSNRKLLSVVRELADERGQIAAVDQKLQLARQDLEQRQKTTNVVATLVPPDDNSVSVTYGQDNRLIALGIASLFIVGLFGIMMWMASSRPRTDEIPFAGAVAVTHDVPGHRPDDFAASDVFENDEREPMIA